MTQVSSANYIVTDIEFILRGRSFYILWTIETLELIHVSLYSSQR